MRNEISHERKDSNDGRDVQVNHPKWSQDFMNSCKSALKALSGDAELHLPKVELHDDYMVRQDSKADVLPSKPDLEAAKPSKNENGKDTYAYIGGNPYFRELQVDQKLP